MKNSWLRRNSEWKKRAFSVTVIIGAAFLSVLSANENGDLLTADVQKWKRSQEEHSSSKPFISETAPSRIAHWQRHAADGNETAQYFLGLCYRFGVAVIKDDTKAIHWLRMAAIQGHTFAQYSLALRYKFRTDAESDEVNYVRWVRAAADNNHAAAQRRLGICYFKGTVVERNLEEAVRWFRKSADQGDHWGQYYLADCLEHGKGVVRDPEQAVQYYTLAAIGGIPVHSAVLLTATSMAVEFHATTNSRISGIVLPRYRDMPVPSSTFPFNTETALALRRT